ncbi:hypothetical protein WUBG_01285 [Wuchereria bancrofti]|uniref:Uncharacterized protein n=1 Tax=Wuchereria bancrofti TaxID=6293 RepID=J9EYX1_WUCBA|nr:hypothetical protein WUBG_01285 [Wuchereria bancrofti]
MTSSPVTAASSNLDDITASLFYQLRDKNRVYDFDVLQCPKCPERLEALELDVYQENGQTYQRIWWTCRGIKNQSCYFPLWVPKEVFWTRRTEEQMRTGYIPLPNIHLLPQRLWYLYPNNNSGTVTPSSGHATRGSSVRPESVFTENEECSRDSFLSTPLLSDGTNPCVPNEMGIWESEIPIRQVQIDEDIEESLGLVEDIHTPSSNDQPNASDQKDYDWESSGNTEAKGTVCNSRLCEMSLIPESWDSRVVTMDFPLDSFTDSVVQFCSQVDSPVLQQREQLEGRNSQESSDKQEVHSDNNTVILEVLRSAPQNDVAHTDEDLKEAECNSEISTKITRKAKTKCWFRRKFFRPDIARGAIGKDESARICKYCSNMGSFPKQKQQRSNSEVVDDKCVVASLMKELVVRVALEIDFVTNEAVSKSLCTGQKQHHLLNIISLEEAKKNFGDLTLEELLKGVSNLKSSAAAQNYLRNWAKVETNIQGRQSITNDRLQQTVDIPHRISNEMTAGLETQPSFRKRRSAGVGRPALPRNLPADQKCIADVEMALKQSIKGIKGPEETSPAPRISILKGSPSKFHPDMISNEIFDSLNWRRPVHFGGRTNLDAFVTAYNLRYNRAEYLDAFGSELCKRKIMKFVPSIPVKQQRLVRRMQQRLSGREDMLDLEMLKKAVDPDALRVQIAHRLGIKDLDSILPCSKVGNNQDGEINSKMQHIASAPFVSPEICESISMEYIQSSEGGEQASISNQSESLQSFPVSEYESNIKTGKEREPKAPFIPSFNDPEVDALVHRKFKNYVHENSTNAVVLQQSSMQQSHMPEHLEASTSRIEYVDFESAFEEYENDEMQQLDSFFDTNFSGHSL